MTDDEAFREFVINRWNALLHRAYLLTGDRGAAEDLVQTTLERMHRRWDRIRARRSRASLRTIPYPARRPS